MPDPANTIKPEQREDNDSCLNSESLEFVERLYERFIEDPTSVEDNWQKHFASLNGAATHPALRPKFEARSIFDPTGARSNGHAHGQPAHNTAPDQQLLETGAGEQDQKSTGDAAGALQHRVDQLIRNYRVRGHIAAKLSPISEAGEDPQEIDPGYYGLNEADMDLPFHTNTISKDEKSKGQTRTLRQIIAQLRETYTRYIGAQFMHIDNLEVRQWLQNRMEAAHNRVRLSRKEQIRILTRLSDAVILEKFIQTKFIGAKSFSLEGAETLIPLMDLALEKAGEQGINEVVIGMPHRGRINVLTNIVGKSPQDIFREFEDRDPDLFIGGGDVKYHLGYSGDWRTRLGRNIHLSLCFNPSHLEYVNTVALGRMRAKQDHSTSNTRGDLGMTMLIHGDAAFAGEGVVQETLNLASLNGYTTGGTLHIIVNNQIGFTTTPREGRTSRYATDIARMHQIPIFHVNGEAPEAVAQVVRLAMDFRARFKRDAVIDMYCYRTRGHNEGDEPSYTQPLMYKAIRKRQSIRDSYLGHLRKLGEITEEDADRISERRKELLEKDLRKARSDSFKPAPLPNKFTGIWKSYYGGREQKKDDVDTGVDQKTLANLLEAQTQVPEGFNIHPKLKRLMKLKREMASGQRPLDWSTAESLAFASLAVSGHRIRLSGQDVQRGTFSQRHSLLHDVNDGHTYCPLSHLSKDQAPVDIYNSPLSESGVLGFEYGFSLDYPSGLIIWEAQFGDFVNAGQVIIDQFISSAEDKWRRLSGLVMLLPHGFEGQGPEHSSARIERFLSMVAEDNMQIVYPTTPAQYFHVLRRQVVRKWRKPLVVMSPKSLLRHPRVVSTFDELAKGKFKRIIPDQQEKPAKKMSRILLCSGKIYYDLVEEREKRQKNDVAIIRMEQFYPFPKDELGEALKNYDESTPAFWVQEEPRNMGAWTHLKAIFCRKLLGKFDFSAIARDPSASPATGSKSAHKIEQKKIVDEAMGD